MGMVDRKISGPLPDRRLEEISGQKAKAHQRVEVTQATACFDDLQFVNAEIDDVAVAVDRNLEQLNEICAQLRRNELQPIGQNRIDKVGQRDRE